MMANKKAVSPYTRLLYDAKRVIYKAYNRKKIGSWFYPKKDLSTVSWKLDDLFHKVKTADDLGYDVKLEATEKGLEVVYEKRPDAIPYPFTY
jgi:hypothetical protein